MVDNYEANSILNKAKTEYVINKLNTKEAQKKFGAMHCYVKPVLLTMIDLFGASISLEDLKNCLSSDVSILYSKTADISAKTEFPYVKNINKQSGFFKPEIKLYVKKESDQPLLVDFFDHCYDNAFSEKGNKSTDEELAVVYKFIHELCHTMSNREISIVKDGLPQPLDIYGTVVAKNGFFVIERSGICTEKFKIGNDGKVENYANLAADDCFYLLDEGITELLTKRIVESSEFKKHLSDCGIEKIPEQKKQIYPRLCATANLFEAMFGDELIKAHFAGKSEIKNNDYVKTFGKFCEKLNELEEKIYFHSSLIYKAYEENNKDDAFLAISNLGTNFDEFNELLFNFMDNNDTIMRARQFGKDKQQLPKKYEKAVDLFINSFNSLYEFVKPVYLDVDNSKKALKFWKKNREQDNSNKIGCVI